MMRVYDQHQLIYIIELHWSYHEWMKENKWNCKENFKILKLKPSIAILEKKYWKEMEIFEVKTSKDISCEFRKVMSMDRN